MPACACSISGMASSLFVEFYADVLALTQGNPCASLLPLLKQLKGWEEVRRLWAAGVAVVLWSAYLLCVRLSIATLAPPVSCCAGAGRGRCWADASQRSYDQPDIPCPELADERGGSLSAAGQLPFALSGIH